MIVCLVPLWFGIAFVGTDGLVGWFVMSVCFVEQRDTAGGLVW